MRTVSNADKPTPITKRIRFVVTPLNVAACPRPTVADIWRCQRWVEQQHGVFPTLVQRCDLLGFSRLDGVIAAVYELEFVDTTSGY